MLYKRSGRFKSEFLLQKWIGDGTGIILPDLTGSLPMPFMRYNRPIRLWAFFLRRTRERMNKGTI